MIEPTMLVLIASQRNLQSSEAQPSMGRARQVRQTLLLPAQRLERVKQHWRAGRIQLSKEVAYAYRSVRRAGVAGPAAVLVYKYFADAVVLADFQ